MDGDSSKRYDRQLAAEQNYGKIVRGGTLSVDDFVAGLQGEFGSEMDERYGSLIVENGLWQEALALAFHADRRVAFRASWALEWAYFNDRGAFRPHVDTFLANYLRATNPSVHRHYTKMLCDMMRRGIMELDETQAHAVVEKTFDLLIDPQTKSAVRVWAAEILYDLSPRLDWVGEQLEEVVRHQMETIPTPAILNHFGKMLGRMARRK